MGRSLPTTTSPTGNRSAGLVGILSGVPANTWFWPMSKPTPRDVAEAAFNCGMCRFLIARVYCVKLRLSAVDCWGDRTLGGSIPLAQAIHEFLDWQALDKGRSPNTVRAYQQDLAMFLAYCAAVDVQTLAQMDRVLLRSYQSQLARGTGGVALSAATRHRRLVAFRSLLKFCAREEWSPGDLGVTIDLPKLPRRLPKPLDAGELERMTADTAAGVELGTARLA